MVEWKEVVEWKDGGRVGRTVVVGKSYKQIYNILL